MSSTITAPGVPGGNYDYDQVPLPTKGSVLQSTGLVKAGYGTLSYDGPNGTPQSKQREVGPANGENHVSSGQASGVSPNLISSA